MRDVGGLLWIVFVIFAVVSSIVQSARRARGGASSRDARGVSSSLNSQVNRSAETPTRVSITAANVSPQLATLIQQFQQQAQAHAAPQVAPAPPRAPRPVAVPQAPAPPVDAPPPSAVVVPLHVEPPRPALRLGLLGSRDALVRAVIAAEVLGKPLALRDE